jgi:hypothetical protein
MEGGKTKTGTGMGTVDYMAPEQYTDASKVDQRADIYALGMTLYEMLAGRLPWAASTTEFKVLTLKSRGDFPPPTDFYPEIPEVVLRALNGALAVELGDRFTDVGAFRSALEGAALEAPAVVAAQAPKAEAVPELESEAAIEPKDSSSVWKTVAWVVGVGFFLSLLANKKEEPPHDEMAAAEASPEAPKAPKARKEEGKVGKTAKPVQRREGPLEPIKVAIRAEGDRILVDFNQDEGWHLTESMTFLELAADQAVSLGEQTWPEVHQRPDPAYPPEDGVMRGEIDGDFTAVGVVEGPAGTHKVKGTVGYQACRAERCLLPVYVDFELGMRVGNGGRH